MSVYFNKEAAQIQLNTTGSSYVMQIRDGLLLHLYWVRVWMTATTAICTGNRAAPPFPAVWRAVQVQFWMIYGWNTRPGGGATTAHPRLRSSIRTGRTLRISVTFPIPLPTAKRRSADFPAMYANAGDDVQTLEITLEDKVGEMRLTLFYSVFYELDIITRHAVFTNLSDEEAILGAALSAAVDFDRADLDIITNYGTHCAERQIERAPLRRGKTVLSSRRGAHGTCP